MSEYFRKINNKIVDNLLLSYLISIGIGAGIFLIVMAVFGWNFSIFTQMPFFMIFLTISGVTMKFLGGLGISLTFASVVILFFKIFAKKMKGKKRVVDIMKILFTILAILICAYGVYVLISGLFQQPLTLLERLTSLILGMFSLIISVYMIPIIKNIYNPHREDTKMDKIKSKLGGVKYSLWKGYKSRIRKDYATVEAKEYQKLKDQIDDLRYKLSGYLLLPLALVFTLFLPLLGVAIILWMRLYTLDKKPLTDIERVLLIVIMVGILVISTIVFLLITVHLLVPIFNTSYAIGIWCSIGLFLYFLYKK